MKKSYNFTRFVNISIRQHLVALDNMLKDFDYSLLEHFENEPLIPGTYLLYFANDYDRNGEVRVRIIKKVDNVLGADDTINRYNELKSNYNRQNEPYILLQNKNMSTEERENILDLLNPKTFEKANNELQDFLNGNSK